MSKKEIIVCFDDNRIKVLCATRSKNAFYVDDAFFLNDDELDDFLKKQKSRDFIVVKNFSEYFFDTITVPPAKGRFLRVIVQNELRKRSRMQEHQFVFTELGEKLVDRRKMKEIFVFAVQQEQIKDIIARFARFGKTIKAFYPAMLATAAFISKDDRPFMGVLGSGSAKKIFLVISGKVHFVRIAQAFDRGMRNQDVTNIAMTVDYCRQTLKISPNQVFLLGGLCTDFEADPTDEFELSSFYHPMLNALVNDRPLGPEFVTALAAMHITPSMGLDMMPADDKLVFMVEKALRVATLVFLVLTGVAALNMSIVMLNVKKHYDEIGLMRRQLSEVNMVVEKFKLKQKQFRKYRPFVECYKRSVEVPDIYGFLYQLSEIKLQQVAIDAVLIGKTGAEEEDTASTDAGNGKNAELRGTVNADTYAQLQEYYQEFLAGVGKMETMRIVQESLDLKNKSFSIKLLFE